MTPTEKSATIHTVAPVMAEPLPLKRKKRGRMLSASFLLLLLLSPEAELALMDASNKATPKKRTKDLLTAILNENFGTLAIQLLRCSLLLKLFFYEIMDDSHSYKVFLVYSLLTLSCQSFSAIVFV